MAIDLKWRDDFGGAALLGDGSFIGTLSLEHWWTEPRGDPAVAWVAGFLDPGSDKYVKVCVEAPAQEVNAKRAPEMVEKVERALAAGPPPLPGPAKTSAPAKLSADEVDDQLDRVIAAWVGALDDLWRVAEERDPAVGYSLYIKLVHALNWAYTADEALQATWNRVPAAKQVVASQDADAKIAAAIADWKTHKPADWTPTQDPIFKPYFRRQRERRPYKDWASVMVAGSFHEEFFGGLNWVSGKMRHSAAELPVELRQMTPGGEPRWKWKLADAIAREDKDKAQRDMYVAHLQEQDVLGLFSWLVEVFVDAQRLIVELLRDAERKP